MAERKYARRTRGTGSDSSPEESRKPEEQDPAAKAREICYRLLTVRSRTRQELEQALHRKEIPDDVAQTILGKFAAIGLIDDEAFAESWVRSRHTYQGLGRRALAMELRRKGVADEVVAEAVDAVDSEAEDERARQLVRKKLGAMSGLEDQVRIRRLVGMLARKGYSEGMAFRVVREELSAYGGDASELDTIPD
ncbi:regulatory protein RecX [Actinokineospora sp.]|uniref:regulatory protein RecX n=1 Tax=Actinokineospora sp. TaxID=1872133 RepID=UPI003D6C3E93